MAEQLLLEGAKFDDGKNRLDLIPIGPLWELGQLYTKGAEKYAPYNWAKGLKYSRCIAALMRHLFQWWWKGEALDKETKCHHLASVAWYAFSLMHYEMNTCMDGSGIYQPYEFDDRPIHWNITKGKELV